VAADLTQDALASKVRFSRSTVANVEVGRHNISRDFWDGARVYSLAERRAQ